MKDRRDDLDKVLGDLSVPPEAPSEADPWTRPTKAKLKRIEQNGPPVSYPPKSLGVVGRHWTPAGVMLVLGGVSALSVTLGGVLGPLLMKPDLSGYVKADELKACRSRLEERERSSERAIDRERERTSGCFDRLGACQSQSGAQEQVIESLGTKRRR